MRTVVFSREKFEALVELLLHRAPLTLAAALLLISIAINFANVIARYLFLAAFYWAEEAMIYLTIWSIFLAAIAVTYDGGHLTMDLLSSNLRPGWRRAVETGIAVICFATFAFMAWQALTVTGMVARN